MSERDLYWLAGLLEGEGCFLPRSGKYQVTISLEMCDEDIVQRVGQLLNAKYFLIHPKNPKHKLSYKISKRGFEAYEMMKLLQPLMGKRRACKIQECIDVYEANAAKQAIIVEARKQMYQDVRLLSKQGHSANELAEKYGVTNYRIYQILRGES